MNRPIPPFITALVLTLVIAVAAVSGVRSIKAQDPKPHNVDLAYCLQCHTDSATVSAMEMKAGLHNTMFTPAFLKAHPLILPKAGVKAAMGNAVCPASGTAAYKSGNW